MDEGNLDSPNRGDTMVEHAVPPRRDAAETFLMRKSRRLFILLSAGVFVTAVAACGQDDAPSLGDVARQARLQKQKDAQAKDGQAKDGPAKDAQRADAPAPGKGGQSKSAPSKDTLLKVVSAKESQTKTSKKVVTNDEIPEHIGPTSTLPAKAKTSGTYTPPPTDGDEKIPPEYWKSQIQAQKAAIASMQSEISNLTASIQYAGSNCVSGCVEWNEEQQRKQQELESMKSQLEEMKNQLEEMQDAARKQGYGTAVYDP